MHLMIGIKNETLRLNKNENQTKKLNGLTINWEKNTKSLKIPGKR